MVLWWIGNAVLLAVVLPVSGVDVMAHSHRLINYVYVAPMERIVWTSMLIAGWRPATPWLSMTGIFILKFRARSIRSIQIINCQFLNARFADKDHPVLGKMRDKASWITQGEIEILRNGQNSLVAGSRT